MSQLCLTWASSKGEISRGGLVSRQKSGGVGSRSRSRSGCPSWFIPTFGTGRDHCPQISGTKIGENWDFLWLFPMFFGLFSRILRQKVGKSRGQSRLFPTSIPIPIYLAHGSEHVGLLSSLSSAFVKITGSVYITFSNKFKNNSAPIFPKFADFWSFEFRALDELSWGFFCISAQILISQPLPQNHKMRKIGREDSW